MKWMSINFGQAGKIKEPVTPVTGLYRVGKSIILPDIPAFFIMVIGRLVGRQGTIAGSKCDNYDD